MDSGFGDEEAYNVYDQPWRKADAVSAIYRPSKNIDKDLYGDDIENLLKSAKRFVVVKLLRFFWLLCQYNISYILSFIICT